MDSLMDSLLDSVMERSSNSDEADEMGSLMERRSRRTKQIKRNLAWTWIVERLMKMWGEMMVWIPHPMTGKGMVMTSPLKRP